MEPLSGWLAEEFKDENIWACGDKNICFTVDQEKYILCNNYPYARNQRAVGHLVTLDHITYHPKVSSVINAIIIMGSYSNHVCTV